MVRPIAFGLIALSALQTVGLTQAPAEIRRTGNGDYVVTYPSPGGAKTFTIVPGNKVEPTVQSRVSQVGQDFLYTYTILNAGNARQAIGSVTLEVFDVRLVTDSAQPADWMFVKPSAGQRLSWGRRPVGDVRIGIEPGRSVSGFVLMSSALPGPVDARAGGAVEPPHIPEDTPKAVADYIMASAVLKATAITPAMAPKINPGRNEPELTPDVFTSRIAFAYTPALERSSHPGRQVMVASLNEAVAAFSKDPRSAVAALERAQNLARDPVGGEWARALGEGLDLCIQFLRQRFGL